MTVDLEPTQRTLLMRLQERPAPLAALMAASLPLAGVLLLNWPAEVMFGLYWAETVMVGGFHWLTLFAVRGTVVDSKLAREPADDPQLMPAECEQRLETDRRRQRLWIPLLTLAPFPDTALR